MTELTEHGLRRPSPRPIPFPGGVSTIPELLARMAVERPDQEALVGRLRRYTYEEMRQAVEAGAAALHALGVRQGDRVACTAPNQTDIVIAFLSVQRLGGVWVGISKLLAAPETLFQLTDSGATFFLGDQAALAKLDGLGDQVSFLKIRIDMEAGDNQWLALIEQYRGQSAPEVKIDPLAPAGIAYTSGTTGHPKGAVHCQHTIMTMGGHTAYRSQFRGADLRRAATTPLTILNLFTGAAFAAFMGGGTFVVMDRLDAVGVAEWIEKEQVESLSIAPPTALDLALKDEILPSALASIDQLSSGGGRTPDEVREAFQKKFGKPLYVTYGLTEAPTSVSGDYADRMPAGASGRAWSHVTIGIRDAEGDLLPPGERGEICVRARDDGPWAGVYVPMLGYWNRPDATRATLDGPWLRTGDVGYLDEQGFLYVVDRMKSLIVRGGQNIYPAEIERVLNAHPEVVDSAALAMPSARFGESVLAVVEAPDAKDPERLKAELAAMCARELARYKWPEAWLVMREFPRNAMMKVNRSTLRDQGLELLDRERRRQSADAG